MSAVLPVTEDDTFIRAALQSAEVPALLLALAQATGDLSILRPDLRPDASDLLGAHRSRCCTTECREDVFWAYNREIDDANRNTAWGASDVHSWYKNELGRVSQNWPYTLREYWQRTSEVTPSDFVFA